MKGKRESKMKFLQKDKNKANFLEAEKGQLFKRFQKLVK